MNWQDILVGIIFWEIVKYIIIKWWYEIFKNK
jgi:hypothetical protein